MTSRRLSIVTLVSVAVLSGLLWLSFQRFNEPVGTARATPSPAAASPALSAAPAATPLEPVPTIRCTPETGPLTGMLASDPCPSAIVAVEAATAGIGVPMERIVIEPGPFYCNEVWPGVGSPRACSMFAIRPGQYMHAWVRFVESERIAAVMLGLDLPENVNEPGATRPPWSTTVVAVEVPPDGWVMP